ncbi:MAG TPA: hypothetical protein VFN55_02110 [Solirubrobacteraceae bacterium]|nr:hypothetical protein [Solirubrobacteraceae bacterium]
MNTVLVRNIVIIAVIAAVVAFLPGGGTGASVIITAISLAFLGSLAWVGTILYRQNRSWLYDLGESRRAGLYVAAGVLAVALTATHRMWSSSAGSVLWLLLVGASVYVIAAVVIAARRY